MTGVCKDAFVLLTVLQLIQLKYVSKKDSYIVEWLQVESQSR